jgi:uncharacterized membrane protein YqjE
MFTVDPAGTSTESTAHGTERPLTGDLPAAVRQVLATLMGIGQSRLALAAVELEEERLRLAQMGLACTVTLFLGFLGAVLLTACVVLWSEPAHRLAVLAGLTAAVCVAAGLAAWWWQGLVSTKPALLQTTLDVLRDDSAAWFGPAKP